MKVLFVYVLILNTQSATIVISGSNISPDYSPRTTESPVYSHVMHHSMSKEDFEEEKMKLKEPGWQNCKI